MNTEIIKFENSLVKMINESILPIEVKRLIIKDVLSQIEAVRPQAIKQETELDKKKQEVKPDDESV